MKRGVSIYIKLLVWEARASKDILFQSWLLSDSSTSMCLKCKRKEERSNRYGAAYRMSRLQANPKYQRSIHVSNQHNFSAMSGATHQKKKKRLAEKENLGGGSRRSIPVHRHWEAAARLASRPCHLPEQLPP